MEVYYLDSSALVKRFAHEQGTAWVVSIVDEEGSNEVFIALVTGAEIAAALARRVRMGTVSVADDQQALAAFRERFYQQYNIVLTTPDIVDRAMDLVQQYGLRGYDAIQLASALFLATELA